MSWSGEQRALVYFPCEGAWRPLNDDAGETFQNIEENIQGHDVMTFYCPACNKNHKSEVRANR